MCSKLIASLFLSLGVLAIVTRIILELITKHHVEKNENIKRTPLMRSIIFDEDTKKSHPEFARIYTRIAISRSIVAVVFLFIIIALSIACKHVFGVGAK